MAFFHFRKWSTFWISVLDEHTSRILVMCFSIFLLSKPFNSSSVEKKSTCINKVSLTNTSSHLACFQICLHLYHKLLMKYVSPSNIPAIWAILEVRVKKINTLNFIHNLYAIQYFTYTCTRYKELKILHFSIFNINEWNIFFLNYKWWSVF